jgi:tetratricopeptide (TPR) repeat protein
LGRVSLEQGLFNDAEAAYARMPSTSEYYPDVIYELVWVYIKKKAWEDASRVIDIFLYGYPEHEYAIRLELIRGRIQMNAGNNEQASKTFNDSKKSLEEVDALLKDLIGDEQAALQLFFSLRDAQSSDPFAITPFQSSGTTSKLPYYAKEILKGQKELLRAIDMSRSVQEEYEELLTMKKEVAEMKELLLANKRLGAIQREKKDISEFQSRLLSLLYNSLMVEFQILKDQSTGSGRKKIERLEENWVRKNQSFLKRSESSKEGYIEAHRTQVQAVQNEAEILLSKVVQLNSDLDRVLQKYDGDDRPESQQKVVSDLQLSLNIEIEEMHNMLKNIVSPSKMMLIMAYVDVDSSTAKEQNRRLFTEWKKMHERELRPLWSGNTGNRESLDTIWNDFSPYMSRMNDFEEKLEKIQESRIGLVLSLLNEEETRINELISGYQNIQGNVDLMSLEASRQGFKNIRSIVTQNILDADLGLVKIQWNRFTRKENLLLSLKEERKKKETRHKTEFDIIKKKLPESTVKDVGAP